MKLHRNLWILLVCCVALGSLLIISDYRVASNISVEHVTLETKYIHPIMGTHRDSEFSINILTPDDSSTENPEPFPTVILLHGDTIGPESTIMVQRELIDNDFLVVTLEIETYDIYQTIMDLNNTLNYLLTRSDVNPSQICMFGHSHGGLFSLLFGAIRNDVIRGVVSANYAEWDSFYLRVRVLDAYLVPDFIKNYSPSRVLFSLDENDERVEDESYEFYTKLSRKTEVQYFHSATSFGHASSVYHFEAIYTEISWLNSILGRVLPSSAEEATSIHSLTTIKRSLSTTLILLGCEIFLLILILRNITWLFSNQK
ncbi:MAG: hypothetical protein KAR20_00435, partial [Candidatus Heimdallarchaeota archaeon]|nr:hypothetical protein [Candidatus Heimdallarchaeota archaeon]